MKIIFHTNQIAERGTEIAIYDYAEGNESFLGGKSFIAAPAGNVYDETVLKRFTDRFDVLLYENKSELDNYIADNCIELFYQISSGDKEEILVTSIPVFVHCVFSTNRHFGSYYCPISDYLNRYYRTHYPVLPHIIKKFPGITENLRNKLNIPASAVVFGGYGGKEQFDIDFVKKNVIETAKKNENIYFMFLNFTPFATDMKNIIFLPKNTSIDYKERFINTCDAMLHARSDGETFGISIAEFSVKNKPVFTWKPDMVHNTKYELMECIRRFRGKKHRYARAHLDFLGNKAIAYHGTMDLAKKLERFDPAAYMGKDLDCYSRRFSPEKVMQIFKNIIEG
jgi:hypothetical protein